ncbi:tyrosine phosphatase family-domain-containing protein [Paraphysoderma sedebokerense]|nr:tyrosine phosphatase family-domain-containing protein [Paraphysoderma sedebokerense]
MSLTPPEAFGIVEPNIYRSNTLHPSNFSFIKTLNLKTAVILSPEVPSRAVMNFLEENGIQLIHLGLQAWKPNIGWRPVSEELIKEGLEIVLNTDYHPVIVICTSGIHETGTFVGCLRKLQHWNFNSIVVEYRSYASSKSRYINEQFVELFDVDLVTLPVKEKLPKWFIDQQILWENEEEEYLRSSMAINQKVSDSSLAVSPPVPVENV